MLGEHEKSLYHEPKASDLQTFPPTVAQAPQVEVKIRRLIKAWERLEGSSYLSQQNRINQPLNQIQIYHSFFSEFTILQ